ncbi:guanylate kinase [Bacillus sp. Marseille-P3800]|uniref:guanylate kinase n=1 Tax=Bacillus sp. Marseille-P3800 TaxID=2014782 RepID=UPI000C06CBA2|nr:guanylate kinase [Bacillus sp. Marseille-P3800]
MSLFLISAPSGAGKTTLMRQVKAFFGEEVLREAVSDTTRPMRPGEQAGKDYHFISEDEFKALLNGGQLCESVKYGGHCYGLTRQELEENSSRHIYAIVEHEGYKQIKENYPDAIGIFLTMSKENCMANMLLRGDSLDAALKRINTYEDEINTRASYDYVIKNVRGKEREIVSVLHGIIQSY